MGAYWVEGVGGAVASLMIAAGVGIYVHQPHRFASKSLSFVPTEPEPVHDEVQMLYHEVRQRVSSIYPLKKDRLRLYADSTTQDVDRQRNIDEPYAFATVDCGDSFAVHVAIKHIKKLTTWVNDQSTRNAMITANFLHEFGHVVHRDSQIMSYASYTLKGQLILMCLFILKQLFIDADFYSAGLATVSFFLMGNISQRLYGFLSKAREYYADEFATKFSMQGVLKEYFALICQHDHHVSSAYSTHPSLVDRIARLGCLMT